MTQWKVLRQRVNIASWLNDMQSKLNLPEDASLYNSSAKSALKLGLFSYPVLQAADVLLYK